MSSKLDGIEIIGNGGSPDGSERLGVVGVGFKVGEVFAEPLGEDFFFVGLRIALGDKLEGVSYRILRFLAKDLLGKFTGGFDEGGFIEKSKGLKWSVGSFGANPAGFAIGGIEDGHGGWVDGALPDGVNASTEKIVAGRLLVFLPHRHFDPKILRLIRADGGAADFFDEEAAESEGLITDDVGREALTGAAGQELVVRIDFEELRSELGLLAVGRAGDDKFLKVLHVPTGADEFGGEPVEESRVGGFFALDAKVFRSFDQAGSKVFLPVAVDGDACGERVVG